MQQPLTQKPGGPSLPPTDVPTLKTLIQNGRDWLGRLAGDEATFRLTATHLIILLVITLAIALSQTQLFQISLGVIHPLEPTAGTELEVPSLPSEAEGGLLTLPTQLTNLFDGVFQRAAVPQTTTQSDADAVAGNANPQILTHIVQPGDTIYDIAGQYGLAPETIMWSNPAFENNPDILSVGQQLTILPVDGIYHQIGSGDTIDGIASTFKTSAQAIIDYPLNNLDPENPTIQAGAWLIVPGGSKPFVPRTVTAYTGPVPDDALPGTGAFAWPAVGTIYQGYWSAHPGIDIAAYSGAPVLAADSGYVVAAGWDDTGYGYSVVIDHGNGYQTLYAHLQAYYVDAGVNVAQGQQIGEMGVSGNATGPHLHFEVRQGTVQRNPVGFLQ